MGSLLKTFIRTGVGVAATLVAREAFKDARNNGSGESTVIGIAAAAIGAGALASEIRDWQRDRICDGSSQRLAIPRR